MKLLYLLLSPTFGMHQYTADLANRMAERSEVFLLTTEDYPADRYSPAIKIQTPFRSTGTGLSLESLRLPALSAIKSAITAIQPDVVHFTGPHLWNVSLLSWLKRRGIGTIHTLHDLDPHSGAGYGRILLLWNRMVLRRAELIIVHGKTYRDRLVSQSRPADGRPADGRPADSTIYLPLLHLFIGYKHRAPAEAAAANPSYDGTILLFGRLEKYKGVDHLLEAFNRIASRALETSVRPTLILAGKSGSFKLPAMLPQGVIAHDRLIEDQEAIELFRSCSLVVLPYADGTQSAVIPSAYYFRKPVVATRVGAFPEYVVENETGLLVEPNDPDALTEALSRILGDKSVQKRLGAAGREWYDKQREIEHESLVEMYARFRL